MSTFFLGEGNLGGDAEYQQVAMGNGEPRHVLRMNVYFDNPIPRDNGYEDRGGYWAPVEVWHREAEHWSTLYQKGMRVLVEGRTVLDEWVDREQNERATFKVEARKVGILPHRLEAVAMRERSSSQPPADKADDMGDEQEDAEESAQQEPEPAKKSSRRKK